MADQDLYLAHISSDGREQRILDHLTGTARLSRQFAEAFGQGEQGYLAGLAHDIGKYSAAFQRRLRGAPVKVDHATAGAVECLRIQQPAAAFAVAGHHGGLPDGGGQGDNPDLRTFCGRINRAWAGKLEPYEEWKEELDLPFPGRLPFKEPLEGMFFTRMLYSCLVDADFLDTAAFMDGDKIICGGDPIGTLDQRFTVYISGWFPPENALNGARCAILQRCLEQGEAQKPGLFTLTVPTGGGKTAASMAFALRHAKANGLRRVIYVIPYTSIIEQTAEVFRDMLGEENVLEHHSGVLYETGSEASPQSVRMAKAAESWDVPVVVTTAVQFFESLYANRSSRCRKLHNLAGSVVIFDEAQMLPVPCLRPCIAAIAQLIRHYGVSALLCTATQPALGPLFREFLPERVPVEIGPSDVCRQKPFRRVCFQNAGLLPWEALASSLNQERQVLCIVNSRKNAYELFQHLQPEGAFHLSTLMYPAHRRSVLREIRQRLKEGRPCRVVSTSLIEAGVDVDFPRVFREMAGLDSILQAAGRCNREGKRPWQESVVTVFEAESPPPPLFSLPIAAGKQALSRFKEPDHPEAIGFYFQELLDLKGEREQDKNGILPLIQEGGMPFQTVAERFHLIDSAVQTVYLPRGEGRALAERLRSGERSRELFRKLGQYGVSVYEPHFRALYEAGDVELLDGESAVLVSQELYEERTGLSLNADSGKGLFI